MSAVPLKLQLFREKLPLSGSDKPYAVHGAGTERFYSRQSRFLSFSLGATVSGPESAVHTVSAFSGDACVRTLSVIAIEYILSQKEKFVKSK